MLNWLGAWAIVFSKVTHVFVACLKFPWNRKAIQHFSSGDGSPRGNKDRWKPDGRGWVDWFFRHAGGLLKWLLILYILYYFVLDVCWLSVEFVSNNHKQFPHLYCLLQYFSVEVDQGAKLRFLQNKTSVQGITVWRKLSSVFLIIYEIYEIVFSYFSSSNLFDVHINQPILIYGCLSLLVY